MKTKLYITALVMLASIAGAKAESDFSGTISADFVSRYIWRGQDLGHVSVQPTLGVAYKGLSLTAWGSVGLTESSDTKEFDLTLAYATGGFNVGITDYWFSTGQDPDARYFLYKAHKTNHVFEGNVGYDFGFLSFQAYVNFAGNDGLNKSGKRAYSTYLELAAPFKFITCDWTATVGAVPMATTSYGTGGFAVTNVGLKATKAIKVTDSFSIPLFAQVIGNPCSQKAYFVFGFTLRP